jgi:hypothetical protein
MSRHIERRLCRSIPSRLLLTGSEGSAPGETYLQINRAGGSFGGSRDKDAVLHERRRTGEGEDHDDDLDPASPNGPGELNMHSFVSELWSGTAVVVHLDDLSGVSFVPALTNHTPK